MRGSYDLTAFPPRLPPLAQLVEQTRRPHTRLSNTPISHQRTLHDIIQNTSPFSTEHVRSRLCCPNINNYVRNLSAITKGMTTTEAERFQTSDYHLRYGISANPVRMDWLCSSSCPSASASSSTSLCASASTTLLRPPSSSPVVAA